MKKQKSSIIPNKKVQHLPFKIGQCTICHTEKNGNKNGNKYAHSKEQPDLCYMCHKRKDTKSRVHGPVAAGMCTSCHDPHQENHRFRLFADRRFDLCVTCHADKKEWVVKVKNKHGAVKIENRCLNCHDPHVSENEKFLKKTTSMDICLSCLNKKIKREEDGTILMNMNKHLDENPDWHATKDLPHHIRKYMKFGKIKAPLRYIPAKTGGSCAPM